MENVTSNSSLNIDTGTPGLLNLPCRASQSEPQLKDMWNSHSTGCQCPDILPCLWLLLFITCQVLYTGNPSSHFPPLCNSVKQQCQQSAWYFLNLPLIHTYWEIIHWTAQVFQYWGSIYTKPWNRVRYKSAGNSSAVVSTFSDFLWVVYTSSQKEMYTTLTFLYSVEEDVAEKELILVCLDRNWLIVG